MTKSEHYFPHLLNDLKTLEISGCSDNPPTDYTSLYGLVKNISDNLHTPDNPYRVNPSELQTHFSRRILDLSGIVFESDKVRSCGKAEYLFLNALEPSSIGDKNQLSPLIFTNEGKAVAFLKPEGAPTAYGLRDDPEHDIFSGCIYDIFYPEFLSVDPIQTAWTADLEGISVTPGRLSVFSIAANARRSLIPNTQEPWMRKILRGNHNAIVTMADEALENAHPLDFYMSV